jgi:hypothetical protein
MGKDLKWTAMVLSGLSLLEVVSPSPRSVDPAIMSFGFHLSGPALFGRQGGHSFETGMQ